VVIGRGRLIASGPIGDFVRTSRRNAVIVRTPQATDLAGLLDRHDVAVDPVEPGTLSVVGMDARAIGDIAFENSIRVHELTNRSATLEEAFLEATQAAQEFEAHEIAGRPGTGERA
jgi:ABC-2 type transport system ATP-binding protein